MATLGRGPHGVNPRLLHLAIQEGGTGFLFPGMAAYAG